MSSQITVIFDHKHFGKEPINILNILDRVINQEQETSETNIFNLAFTGIFQKLLEVPLSHLLVTVRFKIDKKNGRFIYF